MSGAMKAAVLALLCLLSAAALPCLGQKDAYKLLTAMREEWPLPDLPYSYDALEPHLDEATLRVHHQGHFKTYTQGMNKAMRAFGDLMPEFKLAHSPPARMLAFVGGAPHYMRKALLNNGGGYLNHVLYFVTMCPNKGEEQPTPQGQLLADIEQQFGNFSAFKDQFSGEALSLFGSGYVWLAEDDTGQLQITTSHNQDTLLDKGLWPLLPLDVWEHAYYLHHQNQRADYVASWWSVVCWEQVEAIRSFWRAYDIHAPPPDVHGEL